MRVWRCASRVLPWREPGTWPNLPEKDPAQLRVDVTSPGGTTAAALGVLMQETDGLPALMRRAVAAAAARSRELGG